MPHTDILPIFFATDERYAPALGVALHSLLANASDKYRLRIHILTEGMSRETADRLSATVGGRAELSFIDMRERIAPIAERLVLRSYYSSATYFRLYISELFPEYDKALYLDCDIVLNGDVCALYDTPLGDALVAAVPEDVMRRIDVFGRYVEAVMEIPREVYFNAGVLVMNLAAFRREHILDRFITLLGIRRFAVTQDEDYLNVLCYGRVVLLPDTWNTSPLAEEGEVTGVPAIVHYKLDRKPWHYDGVHFGDAFWRYAAATPFADGLRRERDGFADADRARDVASYEALVALAEEEIRREAECPTDPRAKARCCV